MLYMPVHCRYCDEYLFSVKVLRHNTSHELVEQDIRNIKYCPFCGERIGKNEQERKGFTYRKAY